VLNWAQRKLLLQEIKPSETLNNRTKQCEKNWNKNRTSGRFGWPGHVCLALPTFRDSALRLRKEFQNTTLLTGVVKATNNRQFTCSPVVFCKHCALTPAHATNVFKQYTKPSALILAEGYDELLPRILSHISPASGVAKLCPKLYDSHLHSTYRPVQTQHKNSKSGYEFWDRYCVSKLYCDLDCSVRERCEMYIQRGGLHVERFLEEYPVACRLSYTWSVWAERPAGKCAS
jgi:hypothetical protein